MIVLSSLALIKGKKALVTGIASDQSIAVRRCPGSIRAVADAEIDEVELGVV